VLNVRIAIYAIALNEESNIKRFLDSCADADTIIVADTGSTDGTLEELRRGGAWTFQISLQPWRFDDARNAVLAVVPSDIDVCISLDLDEVLSPGWRAALEHSWTPKTTLGRYREVRDHLPDGTPTVVQFGMKIHRRFGYRWRYMVHEVLVADRLDRPCETWISGLQVDHWPDRAKSRADYLALIEAAVAEAPDEPRGLLLLGREYAFHRRWDEADPVLRRYLALAAERWPLQRAAAWRRLGRCGVGKGDLADAIASLREGLRIVPGMRDLWLDLADVYARLDDWQSCLDAATRGLAIPISEGSIANDFRHALGRPYYQASLAARHLGRLKDAHALAVEATFREPDNVRFRRHLQGLGTP
jgi:glycosyltransferase involved in cell wall biosynthesis